MRQMVGEAVTALRKTRHKRCSKTHCCFADLQQAMALTLCQMQVKSRSILSTKQNFHWESENSNSYTERQLMVAQEENLQDLRGLNLRTLCFLVGCHFLPHYALPKQANTTLTLPKYILGATAEKRQLTAKRESD